MQKGIYGYAKRNPQICKKESASMQKGICELIAHKCLFLYFHQESITALALIINS